MKRVILICALTAAAVAHAESYEMPYLAFQSADGTTQTVAADQLVITLSNGQLVATNGELTQTFPLSSLTKMFFTDTATSGISQATTSVDNQDATVEVFTTSGIRMGQFKSLAQARAALKSGIYVMKVNGQNKKIILK